LLATAEADNAEGSILTLKRRSSAL
jgi:hypothetical protein